MLFDYLFLVKNYNTVFLQDTGARIRTFIIPLTEEMHLQQPALFQGLHNSKQQFCFCFTAELVQRAHEFIKEKIIPQLVRMLFLPNYIRLSGNSLFFFEPAEDGENSGRIKMLITAELGKQGIKNIVFETLPAEMPVNNRPDEKVFSISHPLLNTYLAGRAVATDYQAFIRQFNILAHFNKKIMVAVETPEDLLHKTTLIQHFENWIQLTEPLQVKLIRQFVCSEKKAGVLKTENELLKIKLQNNAVYLRDVRQQAQWQISHQAGNGDAPAEYFSTNDPDGFIFQLQTRLAAEKKQSQTILDWYIKEYEVLPMWYKRFGHIIKVITGKRTLKSLFK